MLCYLCPHLDPVGSVILWPWCYIKIHNLFRSDPYPVILSSQLRVPWENKHPFLQKNTNVRFLTSLHLQFNIYRYDTDNDCANVYFWSEVSGQDPKMIRIPDPDQMHSKDPIPDPDQMLPKIRIPDPDKMHSQDPHPRSGSDAFPRSHPRSGSNAFPRSASRFRIRCIPKSGSDAFLI